MNGRQEKGTHGLFGTAASVPHTKYAVTGAFEVEIDSNGAEWLTWQTWTADEPRQPDDADNELNALADFCWLARDVAELEDFVAFAEWYGPLHLCSNPRHGYLPYVSHGMGREQLELGDRNPAEITTSFADWHSGDYLFDKPLPAPTGALKCALSAREPLRVWRQLAREADALVRICEKLRLGDRGNTKDWMKLNLMLDVPAKTSRGKYKAIDTLLSGKWNRKPAHEVLESLDHANGLVRAAALVQQQVTRWMRLGGLRLHYSCDLSRGPAVTVEGVGVLGMIARQLVFRVGRPGVAQFLFCASCGNPFEPKSQTQRKYCDRALCKQRGDRERKRLHARRKRAAKRLSDGNTQG